MILFTVIFIFVIFCLYRIFYIPTYRKFRLYKILRWNKYPIFPIIKYKRLNTATLDFRFKFDSTSWYPEIRDDFELNRICGMTCGKEDIELLWTTSQSSEDIDIYINWKTANQGNIKLLCTIIPGKSYECVIKVNESNFFLCHIYDFKQTMVAKHSIYGHNVNLIKRKWRMLFPEMASRHSLSQTFYLSIIHYF